MNANEISVIIIFHGRHPHLRNVLKGLENGRELPDEVILIEMDSEQLELPLYNLDINHILITDFDPLRLPIAKTRNIGATLAKFETLAFLDVDCVPSYDYIADLRIFDMAANSINMARPMYLDRPIVDVETFEFVKHAMEHPNRPKYQGTKQAQDYGLFWSLCFFMPSQLFFELGGFDETFTGYGAEDTDLAFKCQSRHIPLYLTSHTVYHQQHAFMRPPLKSMESIVKNSNYFYSKWSIWPMANHLQKFNDLGFIKWTIDDTQPIAIIKLPESSTYKNLMVNDEPFA